MILRAHHLMCMGFFKGMGYNEAFTRHMAETIKLLGSDPAVTVTASCDTLCSACPNNKVGVCESLEKVRCYDLAVLEACGLRDGDTLPYSELRRLVAERILDAGLRKSVCGDCEWNMICEEASR